jgi:hypothetical protein
LLLLLLSCITRRYVYGSCHASMIPRAHYMEKLME